MKKQLIALLLVVALLCGTCLVACNTVEVLDSYVFDKDNLAVYDDFVLPKFLGDENKPTQVKWTSDNDAIKLTEREDDYLAEIVFPDTTQTVKLTVTAGKETKEFTVTVNPLAASDFSRAYTFPQNRSKLSVDFDLDQSVTYKGKTATISWEVVDGAPYIAISTDGKKCLVDHQDTTTEVSLRATFSYNGNTATRTYDFTVTKEYSHEEAMHRWHTEYPIQQDLPISGYVVAMHQVYGLNTTFTNATFYMVDDDFCSAYYIWQAGLTEAEGKQFALGAHVTVTGTTNTLYSGLMETQKGGNVVVDENVAKINVDDYVYDFDNDLFAAAPTADYHVSAYARLTNWTVKEIKTAPTDYGNADIMVLTKNGIDVALRTSKYLEYHYANKDAQEFKDIAALGSTVAVGDVVTVKGIMSKYNDSYQMLMVSASDLTKSTADPDNTVYPGLEVKDTVAAVKAAITENGLNTLVTTNKVVNMPASNGKVTVVYSKYADSNAVAINENVITVTPGKAEDIYLKATIKYEDKYETCVIFNIQSEAKTDAEMVAAEKTTLTVANIENAGSYNLPVKGTNYEAVSISWIITNTDIATIESGKLVVAALPATETTITLTATLSCGDANDTKEIQVKIAAAPSITVNKVAVADLQEGKAYVLVMDQTNVNKTLFATGKFDGFYGASTEDLSSAAEVYIEKDTAGIKVYFKDGDNKKYLGFATYTDGTNTRYNLTIGGKIGGSADGADIPTSATNVATSDVWTITDEKMSITAGTSTNNLGTSNTGTYTTFSLSNKDTLFFAYLAEVVDNG